MELGGIQVKPDLERKKMQMLWLQPTRTYTMELPKQKIQSKKLNQGHTLKQASKQDLNTNKSIELLYF